MQELKHYEWWWVVGVGGVLSKMTLAIGMTAMMTMKMLVLIDWGR